MFLPILELRIFPVIRKIFWEFVQVHCSYNDQCPNSIEIKTSYFVPNTVYVCPNLILIPPVFKDRCHHINGICVFD
jgi:hypothetical protein